MPLSGIWKFISNAFLFGTYTGQALNMIDILVQCINPPPPPKILAKMGQTAMDLGAYFLFV